MPENPEGENRVPERPLEARFANYFEIGHNRIEFVIKHGSYYEDDPAPSFHTQIITNPIYAKALLNVLTTSIEEYEAEFGKIPDV